MKTIVSLLLVASLTGCSTTQLSLWIPKKHDPVMFSHLVDVKIAVAKLNCDNKDWSDANAKIERLKVYANLRNDPQADAIVKLEDALDKANKSTNKTFCESVVRMNKVRIDVVVDAWKGR